MCHSVPAERCSSIMNPSILCQAGPNRFIRVGLPGAVADDFSFIGEFLVTRNSDEKSNEHNSPNVKISNGNEDAQKEEDLYDPIYPLRKNLHELPRNCIDLMISGAHLNNHR